MGICFLAVVGIVLARKVPNIREGISLTVAGVNLGLVIYMYQGFKEGADFAFTLLEPIPGLSLSFRVDALGIFFALTAASLWIVNTLYSIGYMRAHHEPKQTRFFSCFAIAIAAVMGAAFAANLFTLFAFYEVLTLCTYPLVVHSETATAKAGAKRYVTYLLGLSIAFQLPALFMVWYMAGTFDFADQGFLANAPRATDGLLTVSFIFFIFGLAKSGIMPFHAWLPSAMVAPTPVSALLHAVAVVKMGVFSVSRVVLHVYGTDLLGDLGVYQVLLYMAAFTVVTASVVALVQDNLKKRLAFSTISQLSYILLGLAMLVPQAVTGGVLHIGIHAFSKITLFFGAGAIYVAAHKTLVSELDGIAKRMPITMAAFTVGSLSMIGVPPVAGIVSKWWLVSGAVESHNYLILAVFLGSTLLNAGYFLPILWRAYFRPLPEGVADEIHEAPWPCVAALSVTALSTVAMFFYPDIFLDLAKSVALASGRSM